MNKNYILILILLGGISIFNASASTGWYLIDTHLCSGCIPVEPNDQYLGFYQVHYLKPNEQFTQYNYNCWGCTVQDYSKIFNQTGLWYWPQNHP